MISFDLSKNEATLLLETIQVFRENTKNVNKMTVASMLEKKIYNVIKKSGT